MKKACAGDYSAQLPQSDADDELHKLAKATNALIQQLKRREDQLRRFDEDSHQATERYQRLETNIPGMVYIFAQHTDGSYSFPYVNPASREMFGIEPDALMRDWMLLGGRIHPKDQGRFYQSVLSSAQNLTPWRQELRLISEDGEERWYDCISRPEMQPDGEILWDGIILDITERKQAENSLLLTRFCFEHTSVGIILFDPDGMVVDVNPVACKNMGYTHEELCRLDVYKIDPLVSTEDVQELLRKMRIKGVHVFESVHQRKDGSRFPVEVTLNGFKYDYDNYVICFANDITERKKAEKALRESEIKYRLLHESMMDAFVSRDMEGHILEANSIYQKMTGYSLEELHQMTYQDLTPAKWHEPEQNIVKREVLTRGFSEVYEKEYLRKDGAIIPIELRTYLLRDDSGEPCGLWAMIRDISERKMTEEHLRLIEFCVENSSISIFQVDEPDARIRMANKHACDTLGYTREELCNMSALEIDTNVTLEGWRKHRKNIRKSKSRTVETTHRRKDGTTFPVEVTISFFNFKGKEYAFSFVQDITERKKVEEDNAKLELQLRQAQKLESVGQLAGGIAHDFNNMLSVILGYAELLKLDLPLESSEWSHVLEIEKAATHSKEITRQLLAFSRKQIIAPESINLNQLIDERKKTLARLIGENIELRFIPADDLGLIRFDPSQLDQILINLAINARDAMPSGGKLTLETGNVTLDEEYCRTHVEHRPASYVLLKISDNGIGMDRETVTHVFEPFFTTKEVGKGTGLGLATVYGIIKQNEGTINVYSEVGLGTTFKIYIPRSDDAPESRKRAEPISLISGSETILLVEDDEMVRGMTSAMLEQLGYTTIIADSPEHAVSICEDNDDKVDLLLTDVVMPGISGTELSEKIQKFRPGIKTLYMSGYTTNVIVHHGMLEDSVNFIQKPFSLNDLARKIRLTLDES
ncbi:PAS domain S-box protein [Candidatus Sumerlaeota bacterium]|nr:PAS domain S-box protein [Candidatus Sumerlaeota bacterium]